MYAKGRPTKPEDCLGWCLDQYPTAKVIQYNNKWHGQLPYCSVLIGSDYYLGKQPNLSNWGNTKYCINIKMMPPSSPPPPPSPPLPPPAPPAQPPPNQQEYCVDGSFKPGGFSGTFSWCTKGSPRQHFPMDCLAICLQEHAWAKVINYKPNNGWPRCTVQNHYDANRTPGTTGGWSGTWYCPIASKVTPPPPSAPTALLLAA